MKKLLTSIMLLSCIAAWGQESQLDVDYQTTETNCVGELIENDGQFLSSGIILQEDENDKISVVIGDAKINDVVTTGHLTTYVADVLTEKLQLCKNVRVLDKDMVMEKRVLKYSPKYQVNVVIQKPDVVNEKNGAAINILAYKGGSQVAQLKSVVNMSARIVDYETGEIVFSCAETGKAQGKANVLTEAGVWGIADVKTNINSGIEDYKHTLSGQAIQMASNKLGDILSKWFAGEITERVVDNRVADVAELDLGRSAEKMTLEKNRLYLGTTKITKHNDAMIFNGKQDLYLLYKKGRKQAANSWIPVTVFGLGSFVPAGFLDDPVKFGIVFGVPTVLAATWSIMLLHSGHKKMKKVASQYNAEIDELNSLRQSKRNNDLSFTITPTGFSLYF